MDPSPPHKRSDSEQRTAPSRKRKAVVDLLPEEMERLEDDELVGGEAPIPATMGEPDPEAVDEEGDEVIEAIQDTLLRKGDPDRDSDEEEEEPSPSDDELSETLDEEGLNKFLQTVVSGNASGSDSSDVEESDSESE